LVEKKDLNKIIKKIEKHTKSSVIVSSSLNKEGLDNIINTLYSFVTEHNKENNNQIKEEKWSP
jgi:tRNA U34 5-carboxymethylaminomethyl modifying GTPase MnmE/TrmE